MTKIFFTLEPPDGSYGGGAFFVKNLSKFLIENGYQVTYRLEDDIDIIFIIDPRKDSHNKFSLIDIERYKLKHPKVKIIHRVNECDIKRIRSIGIEPLILRTMKIADLVVFVSKWLRDYYNHKYVINTPSSAILNGVDSAIYFPKDSIKLNHKIRLITHHWSNNWLKGFHIYNEIDKLLDTRDDIEFIYVGNYNPRYRPRNIKLLPPMSGIELGNIIRSCDIYITATQNEPGAMHYLEGMSCGLPVLYAEGGGGAAEICNISGEEYTDISSMIVKMDKILENYREYVGKIPYEYLHRERCCFEYIKIIKQL